MPSPLRRFGLALVPAALLAAGCQDFPSPTGPKPRPTATTTVGPTATKTAGWTSPNTATRPLTGTTVVATRRWPAETIVGTNTVIDRGTRTVGATFVQTRTATFATTVLVPAYGTDVRNGVPILEAILSNPLKAETEFRNRGVRLQGLGTVGKDERGFFISFPTTAISPGDVKPQPGIVARIPRGEEGPFAELKRDATVTIHAVVRSWRQDVPEAFRGVVIEMDQARLVAVAHAGY